MADEASLRPPPQRYALVTGANKGIGFEICKLLASKGIAVILASRDENRGVGALEKLKELGFSDIVVFHQLDVVDPASAAAVADFIKSKFGRLDILVNNAGISGLEVEGDSSVLEEYIEADSASLVAGGQGEAFHPKANGRIIETLKGAEECIKTNYYGVKTVTETLIPLLLLSDSPTIVNISSALGSLPLVCNEWAKGVLSSKDSLTESRIEEVVEKFLHNFKEDSLEENNWPPHLAAYKVSKSALNAYTSLIANKYPSLIVNASCPGFARTDITYNSGPLSQAEAAEAPLKLALLPRGGPSGSFFYRREALAL